MKIIEHEGINHLATDDGELIMGDLTKEQVAEIQCYFDRINSKKLENKQT